MIASPNLFDHAVKNYVTHISKQSPEKAKIAELITRAADVIKKSDQENQKENPDNQDNADVECNEKTFDELRLICAKNGAPFLEKINPKTAVGMTYLIKLLAKPTSNRETLQKRQAIIKFFTENPDIMAKIEIFLHNIAEEEPTLIEPYKKYSLSDVPKLIPNFILQSTLLIGTLMSLRYYQWNTYKGSITGLSELFLDIIHCMNSNLYILEKSNFEFLTKLFTLEKTIDKKDIFQHLTLHSSLFLFFSLIFTTLKVFVIALDLKKDLKDLFIKSSFSIYSIDTVKLAQRIKNQESFLKTIHIVNNIQPYIPHNFNCLNEDSSYLKKITNLNNSLNNDQNYGINEEGNLIPIGQNYFKEQQISTLLHSRNSFLKNLYRDVGFLDAYIALAQFYRKHNGQFAHYSNASHPTIEIKGAIHPNITDETKAIANDFLHTPSFEKQVIVCSGKNGSGKSFNTKTILLTAWLAQTVGFTLTEKPITITPFSFFNIHANIADSDHYSKFETEKNELAKLFEKITHLEKNNKKSLILFDEPLSTTSSTLAEPILNAFIAMLNNNKRTLSFIITHLHPILAHKNARQISIKVTKNTDGTFNSTRKFQEGPSYDNDAGQMITQALHPTLQPLFLKSYETALQKIKEKNNTIEEKNDDTKRHSV